MRLQSAHSRRSRGFTLIELLTVIAIIGILAAIIIPTTGAVKKSAKKAQTKTQFSQWTQAMIGYKNEYGFFPPINRAAYATPTANKLNSAAFAAALTGRQLDGSAFASGATTAQLYGNKKRQSFYSLSNSDLNEAKTAIVDAFGNTDIVVVYDKDGDGMITNNDYDSGSAMPPVNSISSGNNMTPAPTTEIEADKGPRASVIFYSAGHGASDKDIVYSWE